jgi:hypothetical protein
MVAPGPQRMPFSAMCQGAAVAVLSFTSPLTSVKVACMLSAAFAETVPARSNAAKPATIFARIEPSGKTSV